MDPEAADRGSPIDLAPPRQQQEEQQQQLSQGQLLWRMIHSDLPASLQHEVLRMMSMYDKRALRQVCKDARALVDASVRVIELQRLERNAVGAQTQARALSSFPNVTTLVLRAEGMTTDGMRHFLALNAPLMRRLTRLEADTSAVLFSDTWDAILQACDPSILQAWRPCVANRRMTPFMGQVLGLALHPEGCGLQELDLSLSKANDRDLDTLTRRCHRLKVLNLTACRGVSDQGLQHCGRLLELTTLTLDKTTLTCEGFKAFSERDALAHLHLGWCLGMSIEGCRVVAALPGVKLLTITKHPNTFPALHLLGQGRISGTLQHLQLTGCSFDKPAWEACVQLVMQLSELRVLDLSHTGIQGFPSSLQPLQQHRRGRVRLLTSHASPYKPLPPQ